MSETQHRAQAPQRVAVFVLTLSDTRDAASDTAAADADAASANADDWH